MGLKMARPFDRSADEGCAGLAGRVDGAVVEVERADLVEGVLVPLGWRECERVGVVLVAAVDGISEVEGGVGEAVEVVEVERE